MTTPPFSRDDLQKEVKREVKMRLKVWQTADKGKHRFIKADHQKQFDKMFEVGCLLSVLTDTEYIELYRRFVKRQELKQALKENNLFK